LITSLQNNYSKGINHYPKTLRNAVGLMSEYKKDLSTNPQKSTRNDGISFTNNGNNQRDGTTIATDGREKPKHESTKKH
jgi:hypothetical protein